MPNNSRRLLLVYTVILIIIQPKWAPWPQAEGFLSPGQSSRLALSLYSLRTCRAWRVWPSLPVSISNEQVQLPGSSSTMFPMALEPVVRPSSCTSCMHHGPSHCHLWVSPTQMWCKAPVFPVRNFQLTSFSSGACYWHSPITGLTPEQS